VTIPRILDRLPRPTRITVLALLGCTLAFASEMLTLGLDLEVSVVIAVVLVATALTATGRRWTPLLGAATVAMIIANNPFLVDNLRQVNGIGLFLSTAASVCCAAVAVVAGVVATVLGYRRGRRTRSDERGRTVLSG
jgi:uncharacterized membrane-anchored protein